MIVYVMIVDMEVCFCDQLILVVVDEQIGLCDDVCIMVGFVDVLVEICVIFVVCYLLVDFVSFDEDVKVILCVYCIDIVFYWIVLDFF